MSKKLKTLEEHNGIAWSFHNINWNEPQLNGIACPECGKELYDTQPMVTLTSDPPQKNIACLKNGRVSEGCGYVGYRIC